MIETLRYPARDVVSRVVIGRGALARVGREVRAVTGARRVVVVTDARVAALYGASVERSLRRAGIASGRIVVPRGERAKQASVLTRVWDGLAAQGLERGDAVLALGGGVVGDLAGFAAATWMRGVAWYAVPSTVVAQVDSSIGGKTGIDLAAGKNLAGAFHHASGVLVDPDLLVTLPAPEFRAGLAEVAKVAFATDAALFRALERDAQRIAARDPRAVLAAVRGAIRAKARVVIADEREREGGGRTALNFGHTLGHALEAAAGYRGLRHGEAVAIGMRVAAALSVHDDSLDPAAAARLVALLDAWRLPRRIPGVPIVTLERAMQHDKKRRGAVRWVLTPRVGHASVPRLISTRAVRSALLQAGAVA